jgi:RNA polymerase sigma-70 factor (ECF subfamily)
MFVRDPQIAESIVQDVFVKLWTNKENSKIQTSVKAYLYTAVRNHSLNYLKQAKKTISLLGELDYHDETTNSPETEFIEKETYAEVHKAIDKLPKQCRQIFLMKRYDELKYSEIAEILSISINTVKTQMKRAVKSLLKNLSHLAIFL